MKARLAVPQKPVFYGHGSAFSRQHKSLYHFLKTGLDGHVNLDLGLRRCAKRVSNLKIHPFSEAILSPSCFQCLISNYSIVDCILLNPEIPRWLSRWSYLSQPGCYVTELDRHLTELTCMTLTMVVAFSKFSKFAFFVTQT